MLDFRILGPVQVWVDGEPLALPGPASQRVQPRVRQLAALAPIVADPRIIASGFSRLPAVTASLDTLEPVDERSCATHSPCRGRARRARWPTPRRAARPACRPSRQRTEGRDHMRRRLPTGTTADKA